MTLLSDYTVKIIGKEDVLPIRRLVLRNGQPFPPCVFPGDELATSFHLGGFQSGRLICIGSFFQRSNEKLRGLRQYQLRGMATLKEFQGNRAGSILIREAERIIKERGADLWWCNARVSAAGYYEKLGLEALDEVFMIEGVGPHKVMYREL